MDAVFAALLGAIKANDRERMGPLWTTFDNLLCRHMDLEETSLLPALAKGNPPEARALLDEHRTFRRQLTELGTAIDLHTIRYEEAQRLVEALREHASREDDLLYRWADEVLPPNERRSLVQKAMATLDRCVSSAPR